MCHGQGEDGEVYAGATQADEADDEGEEAGEEGAEEDRRQDIHGQQLEAPDGGVGADAKEGGVAEGEVAGEAE